MASNPKTVKEDASLKEARSLLESNRNQDCEANLAQLLRADSNNAQARKLHAQVLYKLGRFHFAFDEAAQYLKDQPLDSDAVLLIAQINQSMHKPEAAIEYYQRFLKLAAGKAQAADSQKYIALISVLKYEASKKDALKKSIESSSDN